MGAIRNTWSDWGDSLASRFGRATGDDGNTYRAIPVDEASHFTKELTAIVQELLPKSDYNLIVARGRVEAVRFMSAIDMTSTVEFAAKDGRVYRVLSQSASNSWFPRMNEFVMWANEMESQIANTPESVFVKLGALADSAGNLARDVLVGAAGTAGAVVSEGVLSLLLPVGLAVGGVVLTLVVLQKTGVLGSVVEVVT